MASFKYDNVYINSFYTISGPLESNSKLLKHDVKMKDYYYNQKTFEDANIKMQRDVINKVLDQNTDLIIGGDLLEQLSATNFAIKDTNIPFLGIYSACATFPESLIIASSFLQNNNLKNIVCATSSHNLTAERCFRYPVEYGAPRKNIQTFTTTGAIAVKVSNIKSNLKIESSTIGKIVDMDIKDVNNMGAVMAPAAADTLYNHLKELNRDVSYYDLILTGDLGKVGMSILKDYMQKVYKIELNNYVDAGSILYTDKQDIGAGGSGPVCLPLVLFNKVLVKPTYKKILIIGTGSLHNKTSVNQQKSIPAIAHAVSLEIL